MDEDTYSATFGAGCFWGVENNFMQLDGVLETSVGYMGGKFKNPTYFDVCSGMTGHAEVVNLRYNSKSLSFRELCLFFFSLHDPTTLNKQGPDVGTQYRSVIFINNDDEKKVAENVIVELNKEKFNGSIVTQICEASDYYLAEEYHQKYIMKNNLTSCGG